MCSTVLNDVLGVLLFFLPLAVSFPHLKQSSHFILNALCVYLFCVYKEKSWLATMRADGDSAKKMPTKCVY